MQCFSHWKSFIKMANVFFHVGLILLIFQISASTAQQTESDGGRLNRRPIVDPITNLFSDVGRLFLDIDETYSKQTAPKSDFEGRIEERVLGDRRTPLGEYFARIQRNYKNLQNRIGPAIAKGMSDILSGRSTYRVDIKERDGNTFIDASLPFIPLRVFQAPSKDNADKDDISSRQLIQDDSSTEQENEPSEEVSRNPFAKYDHEKRTNPTIAKKTSIEQDKPSDIPRNPFAKHDHKKSEPKTNENPNPESVISEVVERTDNLLQNVQRTNDLLLSLGRKTLDDTAALVRRSDETPKPPESNSENSGRILGDVLYSESTYDDYIKQLLKNHGKWLLDNPLLVPKRTTKDSSKEMPQVDDSSASENDPHRKGPIKEVTTEDSNLGMDESLKKPDNEQFQHVQSNKNPEGSVSAYYDLTKNNKERKDILDIISHAGSEKLSESEEQEDEPRESIILAFTTDGMPLKLRMGPEIENPIKFLHKALRTDGVSLNILVQSYSKIEPADGEILQLGSISGGIVTRSQKFDLSNSYEVKSLLRRLKKSKPPKKF